MVASMVKDFGNDPLADPSFTPLGIWESLKENFLGKTRPLACVQIGVTSLCGGHCVYCPHTTRAWQGRNMSAETFASLWSLLHQTRRVHLQGWGEPLLHPRFMDFARLALKAGCRVSTTTSGVRMDKDLAKELVDSGIDIIAFSLVGTDAQSNAPRAGIPFDRVLESVQLLQKIRNERQAVHLEIHFAYLMLASQMDAVRKLPSLMHELGIHAAIISTMDYIPDLSLAHEAFDPPVTPEAREKIQEAKALLTEAAKEAAKLDTLIHYELPGYSRNGCREEIGQTLYVDENGFFSPCVYTAVPGTMPPDRLSFGQTGQDDSDDPLAVWNRPEWKAFRNNLAQGNPHPRCLHCSKRFEKE